MQPTLSCSLMKANWTLQGKAWIRYATWGCQNSRCLRLDHLYQDQCYIVLCVFSAATAWCDVLTCQLHIDAGTHVLVHAEVHKFLAYLVALLKVFCDHGKELWMLLQPVSECMSSICTDVSNVVGG